MPMVQTSTQISNNVQLSTMVNRALALRSDNGLSKHDCMVHAILVSIDEGHFKRGDKLPSVKSVAVQSGFAKQTVVKAYAELKERGIIDAKPRQGFFIASQSTAQVLRVALVLYAFQAFQEGFHSTFRSCLGAKIHVDTFFHHNNFEVLNDIVAKVAGSYGVYVIAGMDHPKMGEILSMLPHANVLLVDRPPPGGKSYSYVSQEFANTTYDNLSKLHDRIARFREVKLFFREGGDIPTGIKEGFSKYALRQQVEHSILDAYAPGSVSKGVLYITTTDSDLWRILEDCMSLGFVVGRDVGIISHNDSTIKKIIAGGITTISTDFEQMAQYAADYVLNRVATQRYLPTKILIRNSL